MARSIKKGAKAWWGGSPALYTMRRARAANRMKPACFLDRDGVIVVDVNYLSDPAQLSLIDGVGAAIARLNQAGVPTIVITNQSGVARGFFTEERVAEIHRALDDLLEPFGAHVDAYLVCPHHPSEGEGAYVIDCGCRKPKPGLLLRAAKEHGIDMKHSFFIGDQPSDMEAASRAGCTGILVQAESAHGSDEVIIARDLAQAVEHCLPILRRAI